jgi:excisionase family DNA binding protein
VAFRLRDSREAIENILRLRRAERLADQPLRGEIASAREYLESLVGPTVRPAEAARLLGLSQPALSRWIDKGEISAVITPQGRREIPLSELVTLLEEVEELDDSASRPLAAVIGERRRRSSEAINLDRLLPRRRPRSHRTPELHALAYHRLVAERLDERLVEEAARRLRRWRKDGRIHPRWADEWERILAMPLPRIAKAISADTRRARELRQTSPFAGALTEQERRRLHRAVEERASA